MSVAHNPFSTEDKQRLDELAKMSPAEYARCREHLAAELGIAVGFLDQEHKDRRKRAKAKDDDDFLADPEAWPLSVDGADLLDQLSKTVALHVVLPAGGAEAIALWVLFAHAHDCFHISPVLCASSPTPECGKTTLLTFLSRVSPRALLASNISPASVFRAIEKWSPTFLVDEMDTFLLNNEELRGILNSGHNRGSAYVIRTTGDNHEPARFCTWTPKVLALIGKLPPTLASRSIHIELRRKMASEDVTELREGRLGHLERLLRQAARWAQDNRDALRSSEPEMPRSLYGRAADNWRPLLAIADRAGGEWPERSRRIAESLSGRSSEQTTQVMLLEDIRCAFSECVTDQITSTSLVDALTGMEDRPWPEWKLGKPITTRQLARMLEPFDIRPKQLWIGGLGKQRGYERAQFDDVFRRYLGDWSGSPVGRSETANFSGLRSVGPSKSLPDNNGKNPSKPNGSTVLPDAKLLGGNFEGDGGPFISLKDPSLKLKVKLREDDYPELPPFLDRRARD